jgi:hypothetical protein
MPDVAAPCGPLGIFYEMATAIGAALAQGRGIFLAAVSRRPDPLAAAASARLEAVFLPRPPIALVRNFMLVPPLDSFITERARWPAPSLNDTRLS